MLYDAPLSQVFADDLLKEGIYVIGFYYPVVPQGKARIRVQISAGHEREHLDKALEAFAKVGKKHGVIWLGDGVIGVLPGLSLRQAHPSFRQG